MNTRKDFLKALFRSLDAWGISYCVLRNYARLLEDDAPADIDLLVERRNLEGFSESLRSAAGVAGHRFVHHARYVNHSCVFWSAQSNFTRIDFDTEIRWRLFPILSARTMLAKKQRHDGFYIPHPAHESVVLFGQALWVGRLDERYRAQLARLYEACADKEELRSIYRSAFGSAGDELAEIHAEIASREFTDDFSSRLKRSIIRKTFARWSGWRDFARHARADAQRLWERLRQPAGISLLYVTSAGAEKNLDVFMREIEFLFPAQKCFLHTVDLAKGERPAGWGMGKELRRLRALFKGGLCVQFYRLAQDADLAGVIQACSHRLYPSRCFVCQEDSSGQARLMHVGTGFRAGTGEGETGLRTDFSALLIGFISTVLEQENRRGISGRKVVHTAL